MEIDFRKLHAAKLFDFSKKEEELILEIYENLFENYDLSVMNIEDSPYNDFKTNDEIPLITPKICYFITDRYRNFSFYLFIVSKKGTTAKGARTTSEYDSLQIWGIKKLNEDFSFITLNKKKLADKIAGIFSSFNINFNNDSDFKDFYVLGSDQYKTMSFLTPDRKKTIKEFPDDEFQLTVKNNLLSFGLPKELSINNALITAAFLKEI
ncbi:hypothetical protein ACM40_18860 [Chryseobacterium sp. BLS98]|jgi:hypothetical protein|uniref:hypothetical protein n=1 Tax=Chryseobacterium sp. BLS98 TaxID=885586 RepID=UPI00065AA523|nr:hypothetical protein [Chryseobacterium sp. BLS98]KMQ59014.1 hypothetical protein ACM40_18860 [Chryseobacterium sp. BLS98]